MLLMARIKLNILGLKPSLVEARADGR